MELLVDYICGVTLFVIALSMCSIIICSMLPPPLTQIDELELVKIRVINGSVISDRIIKVWIVVFREDGSYWIISAAAPLKLPSGCFIAVFSGVRALYLGSPPEDLNGYIYRWGLSESPPEPPYIQIMEGRVVRIVNRTG